MLWIYLLSCTASEKESVDALCVDADPGDDQQVDESLTDSGLTLDTGDDLEETQWNDGILRILSPQPNAFLPLGEGVEFEAAVLNSDDNALDFEDIVWTTDVDSTWTHTGTTFTDDSLPAGNHILSVSAQLPNGDRLGYAIGGVLVQHPDAGVYTGTMSINVTVTSWDGTEIPVSCAGSATVTVSMDGQTATGSSTCLLTLFEQPLETITDFEIQNTNGVLTGLAIADLVLVGWDFDLSGTVEDGVLQATWSDDVFAVGQMEGSMNLVRVSLY